MLDPTGPVRVTAPQAPHVHETPPARRELTEAQKAALAKGRKTGIKRVPAAKKRGRPANKTAQPKVTPAGRMPPPPPVAPPTAGPGPIPERSASITKQQAAKVQTGLTLAIAGADTVAGMLAPKAWPTEDRLQPEETAQLVGAIYAELTTVPRALELLASMADQGVHAQLAWALACVAMPRLYRRKLIPDAVAFQFIALAANIGGGNPPPADGPPVHVESGSTPVGGGPDGDGQIDASSVFAQDASILNGVSVEA